MLEQLKLNLPECEYIDLRTHNIYLGDFYSDCVKYYKKHSHITQTVNIKTHNPKLSPEAQVSNIYTGYTYDCDSRDAISKIFKIAKQPNQVGEIPGEADYVYYNNDILEDYPVIASTITSIETATNLKFGRIKLRCVGPQHVETIHTDYGDVRFHLPIVTNDDVFFVSGNTTFHMRDTQKLYMLDTNTPHTIVNASGSLYRLHLICTPQCDYTFTNDKIMSATAQYISYAAEALSNLTPHDALLNKDVYNRARATLLKLKKS
jgi:Aspartyl/Asparaginyl beta-hydroxylase